MKDLAINKAVNALEAGEMPSMLAKALGLNSPRFENGPEFIIAGFTQTYTMETRIAIPQQWERFVPKAAAIPALQGKDFYGVCWNSKPDGGFDYMIGVEISSESDLPSEFTTLKLDAHRYAIFTHTGHVSAIPKTIDIIWTRWVPDCGQKIANAPCFERYTSEFNPGTGLGGMEVWIPIDNG